MAGRSLNPLFSDLTTAPQPVLVSATSFRGAGPGPLDPSSPRILFFFCLGSRYSQSPCPCSGARTSSPRQEADCLGPAPPPPTTNLASSEVSARVRRGTSNNRAEAGCSVLRRKVSRAEEDSLGRRRRISRPLAAAVCSVRPRRHHNLSRREVCLGRRLLLLLSLSLGVCSDPRRSRNQGAVCSEGLDSSSRTSNNRTSRAVGCSVDSATRRSPSSRPVVDCLAGLVRVPHSRNSSSRSNNLPCSGVVLCSVASSSRLSSSLSSDRVRRSSHWGPLCGHLVAPLPEVGLIRAHWHLKSEANRNV